MPRPGSARVAACAGLCILALAGSSRAEDPIIYKWVDSNGVAHYTTDKNRIPSAIRDRIERREPAVAPAQPASPSQPVAPAQPVAPQPAASAPPVAPAAPVQRSSPAEPLVQAQPGAPAPAPAAPAVASSPPTAPAPATAAVPAAAVSNLARDAVPAAAAVPSTAVSSPPPFRGEPVEPTAPDLSKPVETNGPGPKRQIPNVPATIESDGVAPEPTGEKTRTATAEIGPRTPVDAAELAELDHQIATLEDKIAKDEDALTVLISVPDPQRKGPLVDDPKFREIAKRLPKLQADLQSLRERRGQVQLAPAPGP